MLRIPNNVERLFNKYYKDNPEWIDGTTRFKNIIKSYLNPDSVVLDAGAGGGGKHNYTDIVKRVVGVDIDEAVLSNPSLDEARVCNIEKMPFESGKFDVVILDYVIEHLREPLPAICEISRVLKPKGVVILRTPNLYHYVYLVGFLVPRLFYPLLLGRKPLEGYYRCNCQRKLKSLFQNLSFKILRWEMIETEPSYLMFCAPIFLWGVFYERLVNRFRFLEVMRSNIFAVFRKTINR